MIVSGADAEMAHRVNDLLLPIVKGVGSERAYQRLTESLQTLGGSGFLQDYPIEQYIRDAKIDTLYEGTTAIQAQDFFFRKIARDHGVALQHVVSQMQKFLDSDTARPELADNRKLLADGGRGSAGHGRRADRVSARLRARTPASSTSSVWSRCRSCSLSVICSIGWLLLQQAEIALNALDGDCRRSTIVPSTSERSPPQHFSRRTCCRSWPPSDGSSTLST